MSRSRIGIIPFIQAQNQSTNGYATALKEMRAGKKISHWIWYIFPQRKGLHEFSSTAKFYAIENFEEACSYLSNNLLFQRYNELVEVVQGKLQSVPVTHLMGSTVDVRKLMSSLTLFREASRVLAATNKEEKFLQLEKNCGSLLNQLGECEDTLELIVQDKQKMNNRHIRASSTKTNSVSALRSPATNILIGRVRNRLLTLTEHYLNKSNLDPLKQGVFSKLHGILKDSTADDATSLAVFKTAVENVDKTMINEHRTADWQRYVYNALSILTLIPAFVRAGNSYYKYGTCHFWKSDAEKAFIGIEDELEQYRQLVR